MSNKCIHYHKYVLSYTCMYIKMYSHICQVSPEFGDLPTRHKTLNQHRFNVDST